MTAPNVPGPTPRGPRPEEPVEGTAPDRTLIERTRRAAVERDLHADGDAGERVPRDDEESSYSTEQEQGAAQPGPPDV